MTKAEWAELEDDSTTTGRYESLLELTIKEDEHPEDYEGPCFCRLCQSYGD